MTWLKAPYLNGQVGAVAVADDLCGMNGMGLWAFGSDLRVVSAERVGAEPTLMLVANSAMGSLPAF